MPAPPFNAPVQLHLATGDMLHIASNPKAKIIVIANEALDHTTTILTFKREEVAALILTLQVELDILTAGT